MNKLTEQQLTDTQGRALYSFFDHQGKRREKPLLIQPDPKLEAMTDSIKLEWLYIQVEAHTEMRDYYDKMIMDEMREIQELHKKNKES